MWSLEDGNLYNSEMKFCENIQSNPYAPMIYYECPYQINLKISTPASVITIIHEIINNDYKYFGKFLAY